MANRLTIYPAMQLPTRNMRPVRFGSALVACTVLVSTSAGQTTKPPAQQGTPADEAVVTLSPFEVNTTQDSGYVATNTLAGSRLNTSLLNTPASISVMTKDFLQDIGALNVSQAMEYGLSSGNDVGGGGANVAASTGNGLIGNDFNFQIRGYRQATQTRDFFNTIISTDVFNLDRIEIARGPNSILFGIGGPGGIVNVTPKRARMDRAITDITLLTGSWNLNRAAIDLNRALIDGKLAVRANAMVQRADGYRDFESDDQERASLAVTFRPRPATTIRFSGEAGHMKQNKVRPWMPFDQISAWRAFGSHFVDFGTPQAPSVLGDQDYSQFQSGNNNRLPAGPSDPIYGTELRTAGHIVNGSGRVYFSDGPLAGKVLYTGTAQENARFYRTSNSSNVAGYNSPRDFTDESVFPRSGNITGPGAYVETDYATYGVFFEQRLGEKLFIEAAVNRATAERLNRQTVGFAGIAIMYDVTSTLPSFTSDMRYDATVGGPNGAAFATKLGIPYAATAQGQNALNFNQLLANPNVGSLMAYAEPSYSESETIRDDGRVSASYELDLGSLGRHMLLGFVSRAETRSENQNFREGNIHPDREAPNHFLNTIRRVAHIDPFSSDVSKRGLPDPFAEKIGPTSLYGLPSEVYESGFVRDNWSKSKNRIDSVAIAAHSNFFADHLVTTAGVRRDRIKIWNHTRIQDSATGATTGLNSPTGVALDQAGNTFTLGAVLHLPRAEWLSVFANRSTNFRDQGGSVYFEDFAVRQNAEIGPLEGKGLDYGLKFSLLGNRLNATITRFQVDLEKQASGHQADVTNYINAIWTTIQNGGPTGTLTDQNNPDGHRVGGTDTRSQRSEGYEFELTANPTANWRVSLNVSKAENQISELGGALSRYIEKHRATWQQNAALNYDINRAPGNLSNAGGSNNVGALITGLDSWLAFVKAQEGQIETNIRPWNANAFSAYQFSRGALKGLTIGGGANYRGEAILGVRPATLANPTIEVFKGGDFITFSGLLAYQFEVRNVGVRLQLNVDNLSDNDDKQVLASSWNPALGQLDTFKYYLNPRSFRLSATFSF